MLLRLQAGVDGGALHLSTMQAAGSGNQLALAGCTLSDNTAGVFGGAVAVYNQGLAVKDSSFEANQVGVQADISRRWIKIRVGLWDSVSGAFLPGHEVCHCRTAVAFTHCAVIHQQDQVACAFSRFLPHWRMVVSATRTCCCSAFRLREGCAVSLCSLEAHSPHVLLLRPRRVAMLAPSTSAMALLQHF